MKQSKRILYVEDEVLIAMYLMMELADSGYDMIRHVVTGEEAIQIALKELPDCILMDIRLAGVLDGIEAARQIKQHADIPVIFITGYPDKDILDRAEKLNPLGIFIKPVSLLKILPLMDLIEPKNR